MAPGSPSFNSALKEVKKARKNLSNFNETVLLNKGFPRWIIVQQKAHLEDLIVEAENKLQEIKKSKNSEQKTHKPERNPYKS